MNKGTVCRFAVVASHPVQYFTPLYQRLARHPGVDLNVFFCRDYGVRARFDKQFDRAVAWDTDLLSGYKHRFLRSVSPIRDTFNPLHAINPGAFTRLLDGYDAVWVNGYMYPSNWFAAAAAALRNTRLMIRSELRLMDRPTRWFDPLRDNLIRAWIRRADALLYIGEANREAYLHYGARETQLHFVPYAADIDALREAHDRVRQQRAETCRAWGIPADKIIVLFVGKLFEKKQPAAMIHLASQPQLAPKIHVVIAGSGPQGSALQEQCSQRGLTNITWLGFVNQSKLPELYAIADVYVMPSLWETWGLVLSEAMAAGAAPVATKDVSASRDLIREDETGYTFAPHDWDALTRHVERLVQDESLRARIGKAAQARSAQYSYDAAVQGILGALSSLGLCAPAA